MAESDTSIFSNMVNDSRTFWIIMIFGTIGLISIQYTKGCFKSTLRRGWTTKFVWFFLQGNELPRFLKLRFLQIAKSDNLKTSNVYTL